VPGGHAPAEANNTSDPVSVTSTLALYPNLKVEGLAISPADGPSGLQSGANVTVTWDDRNAGEGDTTNNGSRPGTFYHYLLVQKVDGGGNVTDTIVSTPLQGGPLGTGASGVAHQQYTFRLPDGARGAGSLRVTVTTDYYSQIYEYAGGATADGNNTRTLSA